jgi:hypothetical protein
MYTLIMGDFDQLPPASWVARQRGCTCDRGAADLRADPACKMHGVAQFKRAWRSTQGKAAIERFRMVMQGHGPAFHIRTRASE